MAVNCHLAILLWLISSFFLVENAVYRHSVAPASLCPISEYIVEDNRLRRHSVNYFTYPLDIYDQKLFKEAKGNHYLPCQSIQSGQFPQKLAHHNCSGEIAVCPMYPDNLSTATMRMKSWLNMPYLCHHANHLMNNSEDVYVVVFGGSVTVGTSCDGCCAGKECQYQSYRSGPHALCSWSTYLTNWLKSFNASKVSLHNFAEPGFNSATMAEQVGDRLFELDRPLNSKDVVFLDHSVNDKLTEYQPLLHSMEALVRRIYRHSDPDSPPTIILLEMAVTGSFYPSAYQKVAEYYELPLWSYRDVALSPFAAVNQSEYVDYMLLNNTEFIHPAWHIHLLYADLLAALMLREFHKCDATPVVPSTLTSASALVDGQEERLDLADLRHLQRNAFQRLKPPLTPQVDDEVCYNAALENRGVSATVALDLPLLSIAANDLLMNHTQAVVGSYSLGISKASDVIGGHWSVYEDRKGEGRGGFIYDSSATATEGTVDHPSLYFSLRVNLSEFMVSHTYGMRLQVTYLKTYFNAGRVKVFICNSSTELTVLDALWPDYTTNKVSIPQVAQHINFNNQLCNASLHSGVPGIATTHPMIEFRHFYPVKDDCPSIVKKNKQTPIKVGTDKHAAECIARDAQKFKVYSVKICKRRN